MPSSFCLPPFLTGLDRAGVVLLLSRPTPWFSLDAGRVES